MPENVNQSRSETERICRRKIPISVIVIACLYLTVGVAGFVVHFKDLRAPDGVWIELTEFVGIVCGVFLLRAQNWARWLAIAWMAFHVAISFGVLREVVIHGLFLAVIVWCLFRRDAARYFRAAQTD
jgi:uncharacterized membrane protein HdeD (DUF308 family)